MGLQTAPSEWLGWLRKAGEGDRFREMWPRTTFWMVMTALRKGEEEGGVRRRRRRRRRGGGCLEELDRLEPLHVEPLHLPSVVLHQFSVLGTKVVRVGVRVDSGLGPLQRLAPLDLQHSRGVGPAVLAGDLQAGKSISQSIKLAAKQALLVGDLQAGAK